MYCLLHQRSSDLKLIKLTCNLSTRLNRAVLIPTPEIDKVINELRSVKDTEIPSFFYSPGLSIYVPTGFGGDRNRVYVPLRHCVSQSPLIFDLITFIHDIKW
jgi:hypothetical protein